MISTPLRTAVFCNDTWHPADRVQRGLSPLARGEFLFEWLETPASWANARLEAYDFVILAKGNTTAPGNMTPWITPEIEEAFVRHVRAGKGLLLIHGGTCYRDRVQLRALTGGAFLQHPPPCPLSFELRSDHPVTKGVSATTLLDEHYEMALDDPRADVFLHTRSQHGVQPAGWTREDNGRICVLTPGHTDEAWADLQFAKLLDNALRWAARKA